MDETPQSAEIRQLRRQLGDLREHQHRSRRASVGLAVALVGLVGGLCVPWAIEHEPYSGTTIGDGVDGSYGGVTAWFDGWLLMGASVETMSEGGWAFLIATLGPLVLAAFAARVLWKLESSLATAVMVLGWVGAVGLSLTWIALMLGNLDAGPGPLVAAAASLVAAITGRSVRSLRPVTPTVPTALSLLGSGGIRATPAPPEEPAN